MRSAMIGAIGAIVSLAITVGLALAFARVIAKLPPDYFVRSPAAPRARRRIVGAIAIALGVALLFLPGPGVAFIVLGLALVDLPFHRRVSAWLFARPSVGDALDRMRRRGGAEPFLRPKRG